MRKVVCFFSCIFALVLLADCQKAPRPVDPDETVEEAVDIAKLFNLWRFDEGDEVVRDADGSLLRTVGYLDSTGDISFPMSYYYALQSDGAVRYAISYLGGQYYYFKTDTDRVSGKKLYVSVLDDQRSVSTNILEDDQNYELYSCSDSGVVLLRSTGRVNRSGATILARWTFVNLNQENRQFEKLAVSRDDPGFQAVADSYLDSLVRFFEDRSGEKWTDEMIQSTREILAARFDTMF